jgi:hypothetical protein
MRPELEQTKADLEASLAPPPALPRFDPHFVRNRDVMLRFLEGQSVKDIAFDLRLDPKQVKAILKRSPIKAEVARLAGLANDRYVTERIDSLTIEAIDLVRDTMRGSVRDELRFKAAKELLDKNPLLKVQDRSEAARALGEGLGEAIITRLAQLESEKASKAEEIDVTPKEEQNENETEDPS